jgi:hypothetical protein
MTKDTREKWAERLRQWRESGMTAEMFAEGKDFEASSLRWADSQLRTKKLRRRRSPETAAVAKATTAPRFLPVRAATQSSSGADVIVEVGAARIRVARGTDLMLVGDLVRALQGGAR